MDGQKDILKNKSFEFALQIIGLYKQLTSDKREFVLSKQLLRSGTSIGANIREARNAESKSDFIHKLSVAQKECDESLYWIELLYESQFLSVSEFEDFKDKALQILKMIRSSILTTKQNIQKSNS